jgi:tetratricopeptide (TPR) repeat protein
MKEYIPGLNRPGQSSLSGFVVAQRLFETGKHEQALEKINQVLLDNAELVDAHWFKGLILKQMGDLDAATESIELALRLDSSDPRAWYELAHIRKQRKRYDAALEAIERALDQAQQSDSSLHKYYLLKGVILTRLERLDEALETYRESVHHDPYFIAGHYELGKLLFKTGAMEEAVRHLELAASLKPEAPTTRIVLGDLWRAQGELYKSAQEYLAAQKLNPSSVTPYRKIGSLFLEHDLANEALRFFRIASYIEPKNIRNFLKIIVIYLRKQRFPEAVEMIHRAQKIEPNRRDLIKLLEKINAMPKNKSNIPTTAMTQPARPANQARPGQLKIVNK